MVTCMDINSIISLINDALGRADMAAFGNWDVVSRILDTIVPDAAANYQP